MQRKRGENKFRIKKLADFKTSDLIFKNINNDDNVENLMIKKYFVKILYTNKIKVK